MQRKPVTKEKALDRLESLCSRSEQCEFDLNRKMFAWGIPTYERKEIIEKLQENRFLDDRRFARSFAKDRARFSYWGPMKIKTELIKRRIKASLIQEALEEVESKDWMKALLHCAVAKAKNLDLNDEEEGFNNRQKLFRYLISRGFSSKNSTKAVALMKKRQTEDCEPMD